jgi:hypothetical protein
MAKISNFPSSAAQPGDFVIGSSPVGRSKKMSIGSIATLVRDSINTLSNFSVSNSGEFAIFTPTTGSTHYISTKYLSSFTPVTTVGFDGVIVDV